MRSSPMLHVTRELDCALEALLELSVSDGGLTCEELAERIGARPHFLSSVLQKLRRGGLLRRRTRSRGGYELAVDASELSLSTVVSVVQGVWSGAAPGPGCPSQPDRFEDLWRDLEREVESRLKGVTLAEMALLAPSA